MQMNIWANNMQEKLDRSAHLSIYATEQALRDANFNTEERLGSNVGIVFGTRNWWHRSY